VSSSASLPGAVLFACNFNQVRSPMAAALMKLAHGEQVYVDSCGLHPGDGVDPFVAAVMAELGADLAHHGAKSFDDLEDGSFDLIVALTPEAHERALAFARGRAIEVEHWPTPDPTLSGGSRDSVMEAYRAARQALRNKISQRFGGPSTMTG
jgi:protein-tyrosine-phosphatase